MTIIRNILLLLLFTVLLVVVPDHVQSLNYQNTAFLTKATTTTTRKQYQFIQQQQHQQQQPYCISSQLCLSSTSTSKTTIEDSIDKLIALQKQASNSSTAAVVVDESTIEGNSNINENENTVTTAEQKHIIHQQKVFDNLVEYFLSNDAVPTELVPTYKNMAKRIIDTIVTTSDSDDDSSTSTKETTTTTTTTTNIRTIRILDVGCGTGVLWEYLVDAAINSGVNVKLHITGIDVSNQMINAATATADTLFEKYMYTIKKEYRPIFEIYQKDINTFQLVPEIRDPGIYTIVEYDTNFRYDCIIFNSIYGNLYNPQIVIQHCINNLLKQNINSKLIISHPLGGKFVEQLHAEDPSTVPHILLQNKQQFINTTLTLPFIVNTVQYGNSNSDSNNVDNTNNNNYYFAVGTRVHRAQTLSTIYKFRGIVNKGYGRGSKQLGFPTANIGSTSTSTSSTSSSNSNTQIIQDALQSIPNGVYFGWALIENDTNDTTTHENDGSLVSSIYNIPQKVIVNIGISPTFIGKENPEKIIEAHILFDHHHHDKSTSTSTSTESLIIIPDFYNKIIQIQLIGFLRYEKKFNSIIQLKEQIQNDVNDASYTLTKEPYTIFSSSFIIPSTSTTTIVPDYESEDFQLAWNRLLIEQQQQQQQ